MLPPLPCFVEHVYFCVVHVRVCVQATAKAERLPSPSLLPLSAPAQRPSAAPSNQGSRHCAASGCPPAPTSLRRHQLRAMPASQPVARPPPAPSQPEPVRQLPPQLPCHCRRLRGRQSPAAFSRVKLQTADRVQSSALMGSLRLVVYSPRCVSPSPVLTEVVLHILAHEVPTCGSP